MPQITQGELSTVPFPESAGDYKMRVEEMIDRANEKAAGIDAVETRLTELRFAIERRVLEDFGVEEYQEIVRGQN